MSASVKLSAKLPGDPEINGLDSIVEQLHDPDHVIAVIAWIVPTKITEDLATGARIPTVELRRIEPIGPADTVPPVVTELAAELYAQRTGRDPLPFDSLVSSHGYVEEHHGRTDVTDEVYVYGEEVDDE